MDDTVSRRHVVDTIHRMRSICDTEDIDDYHDLMVEAVDVLPSVGCKYYRTDEDETGFRVIWCAAGKTQPNWIPCERELPEVGRCVLISVGGMYTAEGCLREDGDWSQFRWDAILRKDMVGAWKPLDEPWRGEEICTKNAK